MEIHSCVRRRIDEIQALLDKAATAPNIVTPKWIGRPQSWAFASSRWEAESQAGRAALVDPGRLSKYAVMYARMHDLLEEMTLEQTDWAKLRTLEHVRRLEPSSTFELNATLQDARYRDWRLALVTSQLLDMANSLQLHAMKNATPESPSVCLPHHHPPSRSGAGERLAIRRTLRSEHPSGCVTPRVRCARRRAPTCSPRAVRCADRRRWH